jgi:16S rRNA (adenine1518-N6/adenine1519-N6)-dimethyltransferase
MPEDRTVQTQGEIRTLLEQAQLAPHKRFGQHFLINRHLMGKLLDLAELTGRQTVLEVGPATGSLTEELLARAARVVAVEIDRGFCALLRRRLADQPRLTLIHGDVLAGKHAIAPQVRAALPASAHLVSNLPYSLATPLVAECLLSSWRAVAGGQSPPPPAFRRMTFTVQREVAERFAAAAGEAYGPVSVIAALLGRVTLGPLVPNTAFWPRPQVTSRIVRVDFDAAAAGRLRSARALTAVLAAAFGHRRKQIRAAARQKGSPFAPPAFEAALRQAGIDPAARAETLRPQQFLHLANALAAEECPAPPARSTS